MTRSTSLSETAREATKYVYHISLAHATLEINDVEEQQRVRDFLEALKIASSNKREVKILGPDLSSKIGGLWERQRCGSQVRVSPRVAGYDVRLQIVDGQKVVIGVGAPQTRSQHGFLIESYVLAAMLEDDFRALWQVGKDLGAHIGDVVVRQVGLCLPLPTLKGILGQLLFVSKEMTQEIVEKLISEKRLLQDNEMVYDASRVETLCELPDRSEKQLRSYCEEQKWLIADSDFERLVRLVQAQAGPPTVPSATT